MKKIGLIFCAIILAVTGLVFSACGENYDNINLTASNAAISVDVGESRDVTFSIGNYRNGLSDALAFYSDDEYVSLSNYVRLGNGKTRITITGVKGGNTTVRATTQEGSKTASVGVSVGEYANSINKKTGILYVTAGRTVESTFRPSDNDYDFYPAATTARDLKFYYVDLGLRKEFTEVKALQTDVGIRLNFVGPENFEVTVQHAQAIPFIAVSTSNLNIGEIEVPSEFYALNELEASSSKLIYTGTETEATEVELVANLPTQAHSTALLSFVVPSSSSLIDVGLQGMGKYSYIVLVNENFKVVDTVNGITTFNFLVSINSMTAGSDNFVFKAYYKGFETYLIEKNVTVKVVAAPRTITINGEATSPEVILYNQNAGAYGYKNLNIAVYPEGSVFSHLEIIETGGRENFSLSYKDRIVTNDSALVIDDLTRPLTVRGINGAVPSIAWIKVRVRSRLLELDYVDFTIWLDIRVGASAIGFEDSNHYYNELIPSSGIFLDLDDGAKDFDGFKVTEVGSHVGLFDIQPIGDALDYASISQVNAETKLNIVPKKEGVASFKITIENGATTTITFRIIRTFKEAAISVVESSQVEEIKTKNEVYSSDLTFRTVTDIAIKNLDEELGSVHFGSTATIRIYDPFMGNISRVIVGSGTHVTAGIVNYDRYEIRLTCHSSGSAKISFEVYGSSIEGFSVVEKLKNIELNVTSFVYLTNLSFRVEKEGNLDYSKDPPTLINESARVIELYYGDLGSDNVYKTATLYPVFEPSNASFFSDPTDNDRVVPSSISREFIYFTCPGYLIEDITSGSAITVTDGRMVVGRIYNISGIVTFDTGSYKITSTMEAAQDIKIYANVKQYTKTFSYEMRIRGVAYIAVKEIGLHNGLDQIDLKATMPEIYISAYVFPSNATNSQIRCFFVPGDGTPSSLINYDRNEELLKQNIFRIFYNAEMLTTAEKASGYILLVASAWVVGNDIEGVGGIRIPIAVGDGTINKPLSIYTEDELLLIGKDASSLSMHYVVAGMLDFQSYDFSASESDWVKAGHDRNLPRLPLGSFPSKWDNSNPEENYEIVPFTGTITGRDYAGIIRLTINSVGGEGTASDLDLYMGLFAKLGVDAIVSNLNIKGKVDSPKSNNIRGGDSVRLYSGMIAGINEGKIINSSVTIDSSELNVKCVLYFGGLVGENKGSIVSAVASDTKNTTTSYIKDLRVQTPWDSAEYPSSISSYVGGVAGINSGIITRAVTTDTALYNLAGYFAIVNIRVLSEGIITGGVAGFLISTSTVNGKIGSLLNLRKKIITEPDPMYFYPESFEGYTDESYTDPNSSIQVKWSMTVGGRVESYNRTVGGVVGRMTGTDALIANVTTRVFVRGADAGAFVGEARGPSSNPTGSAGSIQDSKAEATDDGEKSGIEASFIVRNKAIGIDDSFDALDGGTDKISNDEITETSDLKKVFVGLSRGAISLEEVNGEIAAYSYFTRMVTAAVSGLGAYLGDVVVDLGSVKHGYLFESKAAQITEPELKNRMENKKNTGDPLKDDNLKVGYLFYYEAANSLLQSKFDRHNTINSTEAHYPFTIEPGAEVYFISNNTSVLTIDERGIITVKSTGTVRITMRSLLNAAVEETIYLYITHYVRNAGENPAENSWKFEGERQATQNETEVYAAATGDNYLVGNGSRISIYKNRPVTLYLRTDSFFKNYQNEIIDLVENNSAVLDVEYLDVTGDSDQYTKYTKQGMSYIFHENLSNLGDNDNKENQVKFQTVFELEIGTERYTGEIYKPMETTIRFSKGTTDIVFSLEYIEIMPRDKARFEVKAITDDVKDELRISYRKRNDDGTSGRVEEEIWRKANGVVNNPNSIFAIDRGLFNPGSDYLYDFEISVRDELSADQYGEYYIFFTTPGYSPNVKTIIINVKRQAHENVVLKNYDDASHSGQGDIASDIIVPGQSGVLSVGIFPVTSDFDYIEILNGKDNSLPGRANVVFELLKADGSDKQTGYQLIDGGIRIPKHLISDGGVLSGNIREQIKIRYTLQTLLVEDNQPITFNVRIVRDGHVEVISKTLQTKISARVRISLKNKEPETQGGVYRVARGLRYELELDVYGFLESEIRIQSLNPEIAQIIKENEKYYLQLTRDPVSYSAMQEGISLTLLSYGEREDGSRSAESPLNLMMQEYVIMLNEINSTGAFDGGDLLAGMMDGVIRLAVGNKHNLEALLINGKNIEYDDTIPSIRSSVMSLQTLLRNNGKFEFQTNLTSDDQFGVPMTKPDGTLNLNDDGTYILKSTMVAVERNRKYNTIYFSIDGNNGFSINPLRTNNKDNTTYRVHYSFRYVLSAGLYSISPDGNGIPVRTSFVVDAYQRSTYDSPIPVTNYEQFVNMNEGQYYILLTDIELPISFTPIKTRIKGLDGNNKKIIINGVYEYENIPNVGIFEYINEGAIFRNITVEISKSSSIIITGSNSFIYGVLAAENSGSVTNCYVRTKDFSVLSVVNYTVGSSQSYVAGLIGRNNQNGTVTNSRVSISVQSASSIAGLVAMNSGVIAGSFFRDGTIRSISQNSADRTAGLVIENNSGGKIITSYVSGEHKDSVVIYANNEAKAITSSQPASGFVFTNNGLIYDCYSNIPIYSAPYASGFVFYNGMEIKNCFSTSILENYYQSNFPFVRENSTQARVGLLENCFYLSDGSLNSHIASNEGVANLRKMSLGDFSPNEKNLNEFFSTFAISQEEKAKGVWFIPSDGFESEFMQDGSPMRFSPGRLELVAPNIIAKSSRVLDESRTTTNQETGETTYAYNIEGSDSFGSKYNPFIIADRDLFENEILESSNYNVNDKYYRIVTKIDYSAKTSGLHNITFSGDIEGNGMILSNFILDSAADKVTAGLFAKVGSVSYGSGSVKNLTVQPNIINFPNALSVGTLAGTLEKGYLFNIDVDGFVYGGTGGIVVSGRNIVGGVVGLATNGSKLFNINSKISANAAYMPSAGAGLMNDLDITYGLVPNSSVSYAGAIVGVADNKVDISYASASGEIAVIAEKAGLMFGRIGKDVRANNLKAIVNATNQYVRAHFAGGIIAGELSGVLENSNVVGSGLVLEFFKSSPKVPKAVGGVVGIMRDDSSSNRGLSPNAPKISRVTNNQSITSHSIKVMGGIVGQAYAGTIEQCVLDGVPGTTPGAMDRPTIQSDEVAGGVVGVVGSDTVEVASKVYGTVNISQVAIKPRAIISVNKENYYDGVYAGGLVGMIYDTWKQPEGRIQKLNIDNCYVQGVIMISAVSYNSLIASFAGPFVGGVYSKRVVLDGSTTNTEEILNFIAVNNSYASTPTKTPQYIVKLADKYGDEGSSNAVVDNDEGTSSVLFFKDNDYKANILSGTISKNNYMLGGLGETLIQVSTMHRKNTGFNSLNMIVPYYDQPTPPEIPAIAKSAVIINDQNRFINFTNEATWESRTVYVGWSIYVNSSIKDPYRDEIWRKESYTTGLPYLAFEAGLK